MVTFKVMYRMTSDVYAGQRCLWRSWSMSTTGGRRPPPGHGAGFITPPSGTSQRTLSYADELCLQRRDDPRGSAWRRCHRFSVGSAFPALYDFAMRIAERGRLAEWRRHVARPAEGDVLEIAAGTGLDFPHYRAGVTVIATEPDMRMLERARKRAAGADAMIILVAADAQALPFRDRTFDTAVVGLGLCTIPSPPLALVELRRVLRPGAVARLLEHIRVDLPGVGRLQDLLTPVWRRLAGGCRLNERSVETVKRAGFHRPCSLIHGRIHRGDRGFDADATGKGDGLWRIISAESRQT